MNYLDIFGKLGWFFKQEKRAYISGATMLIMVAIVTSFVPLIISRVIDGMTDGSLTMDTLLFWVMILIVITFAQYAMRYIWRTNIFGTSAKLEKILRQRLFNHFTKMDTVFFQEHRTGDLMAHATNDLGAIRMVAGGGILTLVDSLTQGLLTLFMMFVAVDWRLSLVAILPLPVLAIAIRIIGKKMHFHLDFAIGPGDMQDDHHQDAVSTVVGHEPLSSKNEPTY